MLARCRGKQGVWQDSCIAFLRQGQGQMSDADEICRSSNEDQELVMV